MNELINNRVSSRRKLLSGVSAVTLAVSASAGAPAMAEVSEQPQLWIELGGQFNRVGGQPEPYIPAFTITGEQHGLMPTSNLQSPPKHSIGENGSLSFQPEGSEWKFVASVAYGRSTNGAHRHQDVPTTTFVSSHFPLYIIEHNYNGRYSNGVVHQTADYIVRSLESHAIVDFSVGKDVGLGLWKSELLSQVAVGVRFAQFTSKTSMNLRADPNPHRDGPKYLSALHATIPFNIYYQFYKAKPELDRSFRGWGPSISYKGSVPLMGSNDEDAELTFDWGANAAVLFGRQKTRIHHQTTGDSYGYIPFASPSGEPQFSPHFVHDHYTNSTSKMRSHSVAIPNIGGLLGISLKFPNAKVSVGYHADLFFGAMDGGIDSRKSYDRNFYGPFASVSIGLGG